ncbi:MAG: response regulator, partial [Abditibacteriales bacterium]|nr:response regulator [Abditibacteriales bacterium]
MTKTRILLVDDHVVLRDGLKLLINRQSDMEVVGEAGDGEEALRKVRQLNPDVVLMDLSMPSVNGVEATEALKRSHPHIKVLVLTVHEGDIYLQPALKAGARGYIVKRAAAEVNGALGLFADREVDGKKYTAQQLVDAIVQAAQEVIDGKW